MKGELSRAAKKNTRGRPRVPRRPGAAGSTSPRWGTAIPTAGRRIPPGSSRAPRALRDKPPRESGAVEEQEFLPDRAGDLERRRSEEDPGHAHQHEDPRGLEPRAHPGPARGSHLLFPAEDALDRQVGAVQSPPQHEVPARAMP